jgi:hypothetical protein
VFEYIEAFYNRQRRHSTLEMLSRAAYEQLRPQPLQRQRSTTPTTTIKTNNTNTRCHANRVRSTKGPVVAGFVAYQKQPALLLLVVHGAMIAGGGVGGAQPCERGSVGELLGGRPPLARAWVRLA